jgi:tRNA-(ms[2]io[6]A)-hydroxylase
LIEARSCERFQILAEAVRDPELKVFYAGLLEAEARHHGIYVDLARRLASESDVEVRLQQLARCEAEILAEAPLLARMHT